MFYGELQIHLSNFWQAPHVAARLLAWAQEDGPVIRTSFMAERLMFVVPGSLLARHSDPLIFIEDGPDIAAAVRDIKDPFNQYQSRTWRVGNGEVTNITDVQKVPTLTRVMLKEDGMTVDLEWRGGKEAVAGPTVIVDWGDGTRNYEREHTYLREGLYRIRCYERDQADLPSETFVMVRRLGILA